MFGIIRYISRIITNLKKTPPQNMVSIPNSCKERKWIAIDNKSTDNIDSKKNATFTIMTYNILCQSLVKRTQFPYASKVSLKWKARKELLLSELTFLKPDILCMQEVGTTHWHQLISPQLNRLNYDSEFFQSLYKSHGVSVSWKRNKFHVIDKVSVFLDKTTSVLDEELTADNVAVIVVLRKGEDLGSKEPADPYADSVDTSYKIDSSSSSNNSNNNARSAKGIIVSSTHLYWHPTGCYQRLQQQYALLRALRKVQEEYPDFPVVSCGDYNTTPDDAGYDLMTKPRPVKLNSDQLENLLPCTKDYEDSESELESEFESEESSSINYANVVTGSISDKIEAKRQRLLEQDKRIDEQIANDSERVNRLISEFQNAFPPLRSCYGTYSELDPSYRTDQWEGEPIYTNYTNWKGTLDYIFFTPSVPYLLQSADDTKRGAGGGLGLCEVLSLPPIPRLAPGLPNESFTSDHISLVARFTMS